MQSKELQFLVKRAKRKDAEAFSSLIHCCTKEMYKVAISILMNDEDAADAIQDAVLICWEKIPELKQDKYFKTWLTKILINKCYDIRKQRRRFVELEAYQEAAADGQSNTEWKEALSLLGEKYRTIMILFYEEGYQTGEIAEILKIPRSTVLTRLRRGREKLADYYRRS